MTEGNDDADASSAEDVASDGAIDPASGVEGEASPLVSDATGAWQTIWIARDGPEANLAVDWLREQGVSARTDFENTAILGAWAGMGPGTYTNVQVPESEVEQAKKLLAEMEAKRAEARLARGARCPQCGETGPRNATPPARWAAVALLFIAFVLTQLEMMVCLPIGAIGMLMIFWPMTPVWHCKKCGHRWRGAPPDELTDDDPPSYTATE